MRKLGVILVILLGISIAAGEGMWDKLMMWREHWGADEVLLIIDKETGTRCYAVSNNTVNMSGYAISCVPKQR